MTDMLRITYYAEGHRNGCKVTLYDVCGRTYDDCIVASSRWYGCNSAREQESFLLNIARRDYPEVEWESAHTVEIHNA